jgi:hypothetical protein
MIKPGFSSSARDAVMPTKKVERGITRFDIDERNTHGYMMRICRRGEKVHEFFSDSSHGGRKKALLAARERYQQLVKQLPEAATAKGKMSARNTTGVVGVHVAHTILPNAPGKEYFAYCASWKTATGERRKISFGWDKYGKRNAFQLACLARDKESNDRTRIERLFKSRARLRKKK